MKRYRVVFSAEAIADLDNSFDWGCKNWGEDAARRWYVETRNSVRKLLSLFPLGQSIAPEDDEYDVEVRQMIIGRYRVVFNVERSVVTILHIRGSYSDSQTG